MLAALLFISQRCEAASARAELANKSELLCLHFFLSLARAAQRWLPLPSSFRVHSLIRPLPPQLLCPVLPRERQLEHASTARGKSYPPL